MRPSREGHGQQYQRGGPERTGKRGMGTVTADFSLSPSSPSAPVQDTTSSIVPCLFPRLVPSHVAFLRLPMF